MSCKGHISRSSRKKTQKVVGGDTKIESELRKEKSGVKDTNEEKKDNENSMTTKVQDVEKVMRAEQN